MFQYSTGMLLHHWTPSSYLDGANIDLFTKCHTNVSIYLHVLSSWPHEFLIMLIWQVWHTHTHRHTAKKKNDNYPSIKIKQRQKHDTLMSPLMSYILWRIGFGLAHHQYVPAQTMHYQVLCSIIKANLLIMKVLVLTSSVKRADFRFSLNKTVQMSL